MIALLRPLLRVVLPPVITFAAFVLLWHLAVVAFDLKPFVVPSPGRVYTAAMKNSDVLAQGMLLTGAAALAGFFSSLVIGVLAAFLFAQSRLIQAALYPYAIFFQTVPIIAIAPLVVMWFGFDFTSIVVIAGIVSLFPIITNTTAGLTELDANAVELFRLNNATRLQRLLKLQLPSAVPYIITGAKTSSGLSVIGAIIGEFFAGFGNQRFGLGYLIFQTTKQLRIDEAFAGIILSTVLGLLIFGAVNLFGNAVLLRWRER